MDMTSTIIPRSDQTNSDDLLAGPRTITITRVSANEGNAEQPVNVFYEGDNGKPYRPCKGMRRVMVAIWGADAKAYIGRSMTLYRDPSVTWGGMQVGGIRISHMSHLERETTMALTATKSSRKPYTVRPLKIEPKKQEPFDDQPAPFDWSAWTKDMAARIDACETAEALAELQTDNAGKLIELARAKPKWADALNERFGDRSRQLLGEGEE